MAKISGKTLTVEFLQPRPQPCPPLVGNYNSLAHKRTLWDGFMQVMESVVEVAGNSKITVLKAQQDGESGQVNFVSLEKMNAVAN